MKSVFLWGKKREGARKRGQKKDILKILKLQWRYVYPIFVLWDISLYNEGCEASINLPLSIQGEPECGTIWRYNKEIFFFYFSCFALGFWEVNFSFLRFYHTNNIKFQFRKKWVGQSLPPPHTIKEHFTPIWLGRHNHNIWYLS